MTHGMVMILSGLLKHVRGGLDLKRFDHILIRVGGGTGTKKIRLPYRFCEKPSSNSLFFSLLGLSGVKKMEKNSLFFRYLAYQALGL